MTFLSQIQDLLERTYIPTGVNLEECLISTSRCLELSRLAGSMASDLSMEGRTFLRVVDGRLHLAIFFHPRLISVLEEHHPLHGLNDQNIHPLITFLEELNHAVHASLYFLENRLKVDDEEVLSDLELQAKVDTYLALKLMVHQLRGGKKPTLRQVRWLQTCLFRQESFHYKHEVLERRYRSANELGLRFVRYLDRLSRLHRVELIRAFRAKHYADKCSMILSLS